MAAAESLWSADPGAVLKLWAVFIHHWLQSLSARASLPAAPSFSAFPQGLFSTHYMYTVLLLSKGRQPSSSSILSVLSQKFIFLWLLLFFLFRCNLLFRFRENVFLTASQRSSIFHHLSARNFDGFIFLGLSEHYESCACECVWTRVWTFTEVRASVCVHTIIFSVHASYWMLWAHVCVYV